MIIGVDIGTSYSSVAYLKDGKTAEKVKPGTESDYSVPSAVYVKEDGTLLIGRGAVASRMKDPARFKDNFKRDFGTEKPYLLGGQEVTPDEIYAEYFRYFKKSVEDFTGQKVTKAYITHPVGYAAQKKLRLTQTANYAGFMNVELVDEPTAAALSFFSEQKPKEGETLLIYDLGGGTLDLTLARVANGGLRLLTGSVGDVNLGGADFDRLLYSEIVGAFAKENDLSIALTKIKFTTMLHEAAVSAKLNLSRDTSALVSIPFELGEMLEHTLTRERFNELISELVNKSCTLIERIAKNAGMTPAHIDRVLCVGGSTRIPFVTMRVEETVGKRVLKTADPELAVCLGAVLKEAVFVDPSPDEPETELDGLLEAAKQGDAEAQCDLGFIYCNGCDVEQSDAEAMKWFRKAATQGYAEAQYNLAVMYATGRGGTHKDAEAAKWYQKAAEQGHAAAQNNLGTMYDTGRGGVQNDTLAAQWYSKAAEKGHAMAQYNLGVMYDSGRGVTQSDTEAVKWYRRAAQQGFAAAQNTLGTMYYTGRGVTKNDAAAEKWFRKAAQQKYAVAQYILGTMYDSGRGVAQSDVKAAKWYRKAAAQGHKEARKALLKLTERSANKDKA